MPPIVARCGDARVGFFGDVRFEKLGAENGSLAEAQAEAFDEAVELDLAEVLLMLEEGDLVVGEFFEDGDAQAQADEAVGGEVIGDALVGESAAGFGWFLAVSDGFLKSLHGAADEIEKIFDIPRRTGKENFLAD